MTTQDVLYSRHVPRHGAAPREGFAKRITVAARPGAPGLQSLVVTPPYPRTVSVPCGTHCAGTLATDLLQNLDIEVVPGAVVALLPGGIPVTLPTAVLDGIVSTLDGTLRSVVVPVLQPVLSTLLGGLVNPLLELLGMRIGEMVVSVERVLRHCPVQLRVLLQVLPAGNPGRFGLSIAQGASVLASADALADGGAIGPVDVQPGAAYDIASPAAAGTEAADYIGSWQCLDQGGGSHGSGSGTPFALQVPADVDAALDITCTITQRQRQADVSVRKDNGVDAVLPGSTGAYTIVVSNAGPDAVQGARLSDQLPPGVTLSAPWTCTATAGSACGEASGGTFGTQALISLLLDLGVDGEATIVVPVAYSANPGDF